MLKFYKTWNGRVKIGNKYKNIKWNYLSDENMERWNINLWFVIK